MRENLRRVHVCTPLKPSLTVPWHESSLLSGMFAKINTRCKTNFLSRHGHMVCSDSKDFWCKIALKAISLHCAKKILTYPDHSDCCQRSACGTAQTMHVITHTSPACSQALAMSGCQGPSQCLIGCLRFFFLLPHIGLAANMNYSTQP